jgi:hypothetical protein
MSFTKHKIDLTKCPDLFQCAACVMSVLAGSRLRSGWPRCTPNLAEVPGMINSEFFIDGHLEKQV